MKELNIYDSEKMELFVKRALEDYYEHTKIESICKVQEVDKTDGTFTQIGIRPLIDEDIFLKGANVHPELPAIGMIVANGEIDFLIRTLIENKEAKPIEFKEDILEFPKYAHNFNKAIILSSLDFYIEISDKLMHRIEYKDSKVILDLAYRLIFVPGELMKGRIIIIDENALFWEKQKFHNEFTGKDEKLDIKIEPKTMGKVSITVRSVNKIRYVDPELIKILEVSENGKKS